MRILFICTGNTCRSPLAEGLLRMKVHKEGLAAEVRSAGVAAFEGGPISGNSAAILREAGFEETIRSSAIDEAAVSWADVILTMTAGHKRTVIQRFPAAVEKTFTLKEYVENDQAVLQTITEREQLVAELQLKQALAEPVTEAERQRMRLLEDRLPDYDVSDPFGGSMDTYRAAASEIEACIDKIIDKIRNH